MLGLAMCGEVSLVQGKIVINELPTVAMLGNPQSKEKRRKKCQWLGGSLVTIAASLFGIPSKCTAQCDSA